MENFKEEPVKCPIGETLINGVCVKSPTPPPPSLVNDDQEENKSEDEA